MKTVKVIYYDDFFNCHVCQDENGNKRRIDLFVSGCLPSNVDHESIIGRTVRYDYDHPFISLAEGVEILP